jgi:hypothetical protein
MIQILPDQDPDPQPRFEYIVCTFLQYSNVDLSFFIPVASRTPFHRELPKLALYLSANCQPRVMGVSKSPFAAVRGKYYIHYVHWQLVMRK